MRYAIALPVIALLLGGCGSLKLAVNVSQETSCPANGTLKEAIQNAPRRSMPDVSAVLDAIDQSPQAIRKLLQTGEVASFKGSIPWPSTKVQTHWSNRSYTASSGRKTPATLLKELTGFESINPAADSSELTSTSWSQTALLWPHLTKLSEFSRQASQRVLEMNSLTKMTTQSTSHASASLELSADGKEATLIAQFVQQGGDIALEAMTREEALDALLPVSRGARLSDSEIENIAQKVAEYTAARFIREYFSAYFRGGQLFQTKLDTSSFAKASLDGILDKLQLKTQPTEDEKKVLQAALKSALEEHCKTSGADGCLLSSALGKKAFISRSGSKYQFEGITWDLSYQGRIQSVLNHPKTTDVAPQMVRVMTEALFDAKEPRVPSVGDSTACKEGIYGSGMCVGDSASAELKSALAKVDEKAARADSLAGTVAGTLIRGGWLVALNNEAVANSLENLAAVSARKITEQAAWQELVAKGCASSMPSTTLSVSRSP